ncbi:integrase catalytic domain-containing protein [Anaerobranca gottschalkii]|uniref:Integrase core domain-containing protein n=1 Tax=Anaerobranca gottschalkii DSM 13577 TaxID=1120990 RepID=A0A1I0A2T0_9FIRM|nr:Integrase core domain-containing protein [Anaerobranca gottschalkii DSM 13577]
MIDVFDRTIIDYYIGLNCKALDACNVLKNTIRKRGLVPGMKIPVIRTDNGPQFTTKIFAETCEKLNIEHERLY